MSRKGIPFSIGIINKPRAQRICLPRRFVAFSFDTQDYFTYTESTEKELPIKKQFEVQ
jgi:hypothetical protein